MSQRRALAFILVVALTIALMLAARLGPLPSLLAFGCVVCAALLTLLLFTPQGTEGPEDEPESVSAQSSRPAVERAVGVEEVTPDALLDATMNSMREGALILDPELRIIASNAAAHGIFAGLEGRLEARRLSELTRNPTILEAFGAAVAQGAQTEVVVEMQRGERRIFDLRVSPLRVGVRGVARGAVGVFFDITRLERLERVRQEFLSNVSHELRTPLTAIIAFVETLEEGAIDDAENNRRFLKVIRRNAERMHSLINDILELSAIEAGTVAVEPRPVRLHAVIEEVMAALATRAADCQVTLRNEVGPEVSVEADAHRLEQMLTNLLDNAIKFNREGGEVFVRHAATEGRDRISVTDTGEGIPPNHIERIFERFYRVDRARSREMGGTGLGLAIVKHLARAHGGEATVESTPGTGSTFIIELPKAVHSDK